MKRLNISSYEKDGVASFNQLVPELMYNLLHNLPGIAYRCKADHDWTMLFLSEGCLDLTGYSPDELLYNTGVSYEEIILEEDRDYVRKAVDKGIASKDQFMIQYRIKRKDGIVIWVWEQGNAVYDLEDNAVYIDGFIGDITDLKHKEFEILKLSNELKEHNTLKDRFFNTIAHDLQNPIFAIISLADFITKSKDILNVEQIIDFCKQILASAQSINGHLDNLMEWSRMQIGFSNSKPSKVHIAELIESTISVLSRHYIDKQIKYIVTIPEKMQFETDVKLLNSIVRNILSNAISHSEPEQSIRIEAVYEESGIKLVFTDEGAGIPRSVLNTIINNNISGDNGAQPTDFSNGMGLLLVRNYVRQLGGEFLIESKLKKGTKITLILPCLCPGFREGTYVHDKKITVRDI